MGGVNGLVSPEVTSPAVWGLTKTNLWTRTGAHCSLQDSQHAAWVMPASAERREAITATAAKSGSIIWSAAVSAA